MSIIAQKSVLFQYVCFSFVALTMAFSGALLNNSSTQDFDNGSTISTPTTVEKIDSLEKPQAEVATSFKQPATKTATVKSGKTLTFNQPVREVAFYSNGNYCTTVDAGTGIIHCSGTNFYFAHRAYAFKNLSSANIGDQITINGRTYRVSAKVQKTATELAKNNGMKNVIYSGHAATLMTCAGPNNSERLIIFAD